jgi:hypothetical protein
VKASSDLLMIVRNNYHWLGEDSPVLANGDFVEVMKGKKNRRNARVQICHGRRFVY